MKFNQINKVILFGGAPLLIATVRWLQEMRLDVLVYTSPRHLREVLDASGQTLEDKLTLLSVSYVVTEDISVEKNLLEQITSTTLGIGIGEAWSFTAEIIDKFQGRLLDFMGIPMPRYRGGAHYTWMILRGERVGGCNLQIINTEMKQGVFDSGEIVKSKLYAFPEFARTPMDYFNFAVSEEVEFIGDFLNEIKSGKDFKLSALNERESLYLPRLNTMRHGWIDWAWDGKQVEQFICAFDEPYVGARTYVNGFRVYLKSAFLDNTEAPFHPFQSGLITRITQEEGIVIATTSGHLIVKKVLNEDGTSALLGLSIGDRLYTPLEVLNSALQYKAEYAATV